MQLNITGHHMDVTPAIRSYIENKFKRLERYFDHITHAHFVLTIEKERQIAEATISVSGAKLFADDEQDSLYFAIDSLIDKLDRQLKKRKGKLIDRHRAEKESKDTIS